MQFSLQAAVRVVLGVASLGLSLSVAGAGLICGRDAAGHYVPCLPMSAAPNPAEAGATVTLDAKFAASAQLSPSVQFYESGILLGSGPTDLTSRIAEFKATFNAGHHILTAKAGTYHSSSGLAVFPNQGLYRADNGLFIIDYDADLVADAYVGFGGVPGDVALVGDVLGNGKDAFVIYRKGLWFVSTKWDGNVDIVYAFGGKPGDIPLLADMDGDGKADLVIYRDGTWFVSTNRDGVANYRYYFGGVPGQIPLLADMDGDGNVDLIIYRAGIWSVSTNRDGVANQVFAFGGGGHDIPIASNWYAVDRVADPIIYRDGTWFVGTHATRDGTRGAVFYFGGPGLGDVPLLGTFR